MQLADFNNAHEGRTFLVVAPGPSAEGAEELQTNGLVTIAVSKAASLCSPHYLVMGDPLERFGVIDQQEILNANQLATFCAMGAAGLTPDMVTVKLDTTERLDLDHPDKLAAHITTTYVATTLAVRMGAKRIGVIGHDLVGHKVLSKGMFPELINEGWRELGEALAGRGVELGMLSEVTMVTSVERRSKAWLAGVEV